MRLLVCGDRDWQDLPLVYAALAQIVELEKARGKPLEVVIHGGARGADLLAGAAADSLGVPQEVYPALWAVQGRAAGVLRNQRMLDEARPTFVVAFHDDIVHSRGTADMIRRAKAAGLGVMLVTHAGKYLLREGLPVVMTAD